MFLLAPNQHFRLSSVVHLLSLYGAFYLLFIFLKTYYISFASNFNELFGGVGGWGGGRRGVDVVWQGSLV